MQLNDSTLFRQQAFIDGDWRDARGGDVIPVSNPANGKPLGNVPKMGRKRRATPSTPPIAPCPPGARSPPKSEPISCVAGLI